MMDIRHTKEIVLMLNGQSLERVKVDKSISTGFHRQGYYLILSLFEKFNFSFEFYSENIRDTTIEVKKGPLRKIGKNGYLQCIALSKRPDLIANINDTYIINVDGKYFEFIDDNNKT